VYFSPEESKRNSWNLG